MIICKLSDRVNFALILTYLFVIYYFDLGTVELLLPSCAHQLSYNLEYTGADDATNNNSTNNTVLAKAVLSEANGSKFIGSKVLGNLVKLRGKRNQLFKETSQNKYFEFWKLNDTGNKKHIILSEYYRFILLFNFVFNKNFVKKSFYFKVCIGKLGKIFWILIIQPSTLYCIICLNI